jgi:transposase
MRVRQAFRFELDPNREARIALAKHVGAARFAYNWGLARCLEAQARGEQIPSAVELHKDWNEWKRKHAPWWVEVSKCAPQEAFRDLERAVRNWREGRAGFPRFKRKKALADNKARLTGSIRVTPRHVQLPRIGKVRTKERTDKLLELLQAKKARILSATISREADRWFVSLTCEVERPDPAPREIRGPEDVVGIDVGLESLPGLAAGPLIVAPMSFPSTRLCSRCGHPHGKMPLSQRVFRCEACGLEMDRDLNAALNLRAYGLAHLTGPTASSAGSDACGDPSGGGTALLGWSTSHGSVKQEVAHRHHSLEG